MSAGQLPREDVVSSRPEGFGGVIRRRHISTRVNLRAIAVSVVLAVLVVVVGCWSISVGDFPIAISEVVRTLLGNPTAGSEFIVGTLRLPRVFAGALVGAALAISGVIFQSLTRNPLGSPDVIGFTTGSGLGAVVVIVLADGSSSVAVSTGAVIGGLLTAIALYALAWKSGIQAYRLVLVGVGLGFALRAGSDYLLTRAEIYDVQRAAVWLTGSLNGSTWAQVRPLALAMVVLIAASLALCRSLRLLTLGDDAAAALGVSVARTKLVLVLVGVASVGVATATAGPIAFVALIAPPIGRRLARAPDVSVVPTALVGALLTITADLAARRILAPVELPVGTATAVLGAPYLLWLLTREVRSGAM